MGYDNRAIAYEKKGELDKAIADFTEVIRLDPQEGGRYFERGLAYQKKGEKAKAEVDFTQAKKLGYKGP